MVDLILRLSHKFGVLPVFNPEQPSPKRNWALNDVAAAKSAIEGIMGFKMEFPNCLGYDTRAGLPRRFVYYCAAAHSANLFLNGIASKHVLEIGAGIGCLGLISHRLKSAAYTVIDLPEVAVISACLMSYVVSEDMIWLYGEPESSRAFARFYPATHLEAVRGQCDLIFNSDSFPEMLTSTQDDYINLIAERLSDGGIFMSINHESDLSEQSGVFAAVQRSGKLKLVSRCPWMIRDGYVEEFYRKA
jgi:hypothetical protein